MIIGGPTAYKVWKEKDWVVALHWLGLAGETEQPTAILRPARWAGRCPQGVSPYAIQLSSCHTFVGRNGYPTENLMRAAQKCAEVTGSFQDRFTLRTIGDILLNVVDELVHMPPRKMVNAPEDVVDGPVVGEMTLTQAGEVVANKDITVPGAAFQ